MKFILIGSALVFVLGCKKQYTCACSNGTSQTFSEKMTKKQADASCKEIEKSINQTYNNISAQICSVK